MRWRALLVAKGFTQQKGVDHNEVFALVVRYSTVRMMLAVAAQLGLGLRFVDVETAFLNGKLEETIFTDQPQGFVERRKEHLVYQFLKALYGLKQASRAWRKLINTFRRSIACVRSVADPSLYMLIFQGEHVYILVYVDDMLLLSRLGRTLEAIAALIATRFEVRIESNVSKFLGMSIEQDPFTKSIKIHSNSMIEQMPKNFECVNCKPMSIPVPPGTVLTKRIAPFDEGEKEKMNSVPYRQLVGSILHLSNTTRPDLAFTGGYLSLFMSNPEFGHWKAARNVLRYLKDTKTFGIMYKGPNSNQDIKMLVYSDSDFAADVVNRTAIVGHCFLFCSAVVSWRSKKQEVVAQSTVEAEYIALSFAVREVLWLMKCEGVQSMKKIPINVGCDNHGALTIESEDIENERS